MDRGTSPARGGDEERLLAALDRLLRRAMGISMPAYGRARLAPLPFASVWAGAYMLAAAAVIGFAEYIGARSDPRFVGLLVWGLVYFTAVLFFARLATLRVLDIVRRDILPYATSAFVAAVADDLERRHSAMTRWIVPLLVALLAMAASGVALTYEEPVIDLDRYAPERTFWSFIAFYICFVAARGVLAGRFYEPFARRLELARERFYVLGAADTPLVRGVAGLGQQMLILWAMIFLAILSIMLLGADFLGRYGFGARSPFLWFVVPTAGFASLGYGSLVYLRSEGAIREALGRFAAAQAEILQRRCNEQLDPAAGRLPEDAGEVERLGGWHDRILAGARYGNRLGTVLSYTLPFVMPLLSLVQWLLAGAGDSP
jgi:hypothetical protein